jgi:hypothetical protein
MMQSAIYGRLGQDPVASSQTSNGKDMTRAGELLMVGKTDEPTEAERQTVRILQTVGHVMPYTPISGRTAAHPCVSPRPTSAGNCPVHHPGGSTHEEVCA